MNRKFYGIIGILCIAGLVEAADITQTATFSTKYPPITNQKFYENTCDAVYALVNTDVPALIADQNGDRAITGDLTVTSNGTFGAAVDADNYTCDADAGVDTQAEGTLELGAATADKVEIADTGVSTDVEGPLVVKEDITSDEIDAENAGTLLIGKATATKVEIADTGVETEIQGTLDVQEAATFTGNITMSSVPTSTNGLTSGMFWSDNNILKIIP